MYLDPSFGGMLLQILVAIIAGGGAVWFGMRRKLRSMAKQSKADSAKAVLDAPASAEGVVDMMEDEGGRK